MPERYKTVLSIAEAEITEKKSRFIAGVSPIETEGDAQAFIDVARKKHFNASHHCYAYQLGDKQRYSDDGEPSQTAGLPILSVLSGAGVRNCIIVVTRYFGGVLLGTGGLVRAYTAAAKAGLGSAVIIEKVPVNVVSIKTDYALSAKARHTIISCGCIIHETRYTDIVEFIVYAEPELCGGLINAVTDATAAAAQTAVLDTIYHSIPCVGMRS